VLGILAAFFLSYATLVLGLAHGWLGVAPSDVQHTVALFQISWLAAFVLLALASVRLPFAFTVLFVAFAAALVLLLINTLGPSASAGKAAGIVVLVIGAAAGYVFLAIASRASGGPEYPLGRPIAR
jgi:succinate-acetate transporter protein